MTGKAKIVKAGLESIAYQSTDVIKVMERDMTASIEEFRVDGGATKNTYSMQFQSDMLGNKVKVAKTEELSGIGAAYVAGIKCGLYGKSIFSLLENKSYETKMNREVQHVKYNGLKNTLKQLQKND